MTIAAIYCRISADKAGDALGVARQEADCRALAARLGWDVAEVYVDNDVSAYSGKKRPAYERLLAAVRAHKLDAVLAYAPDRFYRRTRDLATFIDIMTEAKCAVQTVAAGEVDLTTATGRMNARVIGAFAEFRSDQQGELIRRKIDERTARGLPHSGQRPYGWEMDRMTIREAEAEWIRWGVKQTLAGVPLRSQFRELNANGITNSRGGAWTHATYRGVLTTARHAGLMRDGSRGTWPQIVTPEEHRAVLRLLSDPKRITTPGRAGKLHLLSGLARCGICGGPIRVGKSSGNGRVAYSVYRCYPSGEIQRNQEHIDEFVLAVIAARLRRKDAVCLLAAQDNEEASAARLAAESEADRLRLLLDEAADEHARAGLSVRQLAAYCAPLRAQLAEAEKASTPPRDRDAVLGDVVRAPDRGVAFRGLAVDRQRAVIDMLITIKIGRGLRGNVFRPEGIEIDWK